MNIIKLAKANKKTTAVCGLRSKFKAGPNIISNKPITEEIKNLGNRKTFSQKVGIYLFLYLNKILGNNYYITIFIFYFRL